VPGVCGSDDCPGPHRGRQIYDVSYSTAARAVRVLRERGLIYGEPGRDLPE